MLKFFPVLGGYGVLLKDPDGQMLQVIKVNDVGLPLQVSVDLIQVGHQRSESSCGRKQPADGRVQRLWGLSEKMVLQAFDILFHQLTSFLDAFLEGWVHVTLIASNGLQLVKGKVLQRLISLGIALSNGRNEVFEMIQVPVDGGQIRRRSPRIQTEVCRFSVGVQKALQFFCQHGQQSLQPRTALRRLCPKAFRLGSQPRHGLWLGLDEAVNLPEEIFDPLICPISGKSLNEMNKISFSLGISRFQSLRHSFLSQCFQQCGISHLKGRIHIDHVKVLAHQIITKGMEGHDVGAACFFKLCSEPLNVCPRRPHFFCQFLNDAASHFAGRRVGKGDNQHLPYWDPVF